MKCIDCPLCVGDQGYYGDDCDIYCLITGDYADIEGGCRRTNKFILSQSPQRLKEKRAEEIAQSWSEFADLIEEIEREWEMNNAKCFVSNKE